MKLKPLPIPIPLDYADLLGMDPSNISHCNAGRRKFQPEKAVLLMEASLTDERLTGLCLFQLWPKAKLAEPWICKNRGSRAK